MRRFAQATFVLICLVCLAPGIATLARADDASKRAGIDSSVDSALSNLYASVPGSQGVVGRAAGVLVFPKIAKAGFIVGGATGDGALRIGGKTAGYYNTSGLSFGLQAGAEEHAMAIVFMTRDALQHFQNSDGWDAGADASVAVVQVGAGGKLDASQLTKPVEVFVYGNKGLMGSLSLEGTKITRLKP
jgi:lipid-binding SYLF domain-containing protein